jgi:hypothetical protein
MRYRGPGPIKPDMTNEPNMSKVEYLQAGDKRKTVVSAPSAPIADQAGEEPAIDANPTNSTCGTSRAARGIRNKKTKERQENDLKIVPRAVFA